MMCGAAVLLAAGLFVRSDPQASTVLFLLGTSLFVGALFILTIGPAPSVNRSLAGLLPVQGMVQLGRLYRELGAGTRVVTIPPYEGRPLPAEFHPVEKGALSHSGFHQVLQEVTMGGQSGFLVDPQGLPLLLMLRDRHRLVLPGEPDALFGAILEVLADILDVADSVESRYSSTRMTLVLQGYALFDGCRTLTRDDPSCCQRVPCPVCSLICCMIAEGLRSPVEIRAITLDNRTRSVSLQIMIGRSA
jgi:hypothetical protein